MKSRPDSVNRYRSPRKPTETTSRARPWAGWAILVIVLLLGLLVYLAYAARVPRGPFRADSRPSGSADPITLPALRERALPEQARIAVQNGTGVEGLATRVTGYLKSQGFAAIEPGNAHETAAQTEIIDYHGDVHTVGYLSALLRVGPAGILQVNDPNPNADVVVILGGDWAQSPELP